MRHKPRETRGPIETYGILDNLLLRSFFVTSRAKRAALLKRIGLSLNGFIPVLSVTSRAKRAALLKHRGIVLFLGVLS